MGATAIGLDVLIDQLANPASAGPGPITLDDLVPILEEIGAAFRIIKDTMDAADSQMREAVTAATDAATHIEEVGTDFKQVTEHTYTVVIPHSLSWLAGYVVSHWIDPLRARVATLEHAVQAVRDRVQALERWRVGYVDPMLLLWVTFRDWFNTWPIRILGVWHDWFEHPSQFAEWATPPLVGPIIAYLAERAHKQSRDNLSLIVTRAWQETPDQTLDLIFEWLVTGKSGG